MSQNVKPSLETVAKVAHALGFTEAEWERIQKQPQLQTKIRQLVWSQPEVLVLRLTAAANVLYQSSILGELLVQCEPIISTDAERMELLELLKWDIHLHFQRLSDRTRTAVIIRYGLHDEGFPRELAEVAEMMSISVDRARQLINNGMSKLTSSARAMFLEQKRIKALMDDPSLSEMAIEDLDLSERPRVLLKRAFINTIADLVVKSPDDLLCITNFGVTCLAEVEGKLAALNLSLKPKAH